MRGTPCLRGKNRTKKKQCNECKTTHFRHVPLACSRLTTHKPSLKSKVQNMSDNSSANTDVSTIHLDNTSSQDLDNVDTDSKFIGFDLSTQQLKAIAIDDKLKVRHHVSVNFDQELAEYKTKGGVHRSDDGSNTVSAPVNMWLKALDICFERLKLDGLDFGSVLCISGCAQQHGSVWWRRESSQLLANMSADEYLHKELVTAFSLRESPVWMDSSTSEECRELEHYVGGPTRLAELTGSRAYERFTGAQIARIFKHRREAYMVTERITLIGNFLSSLFCGKYTPFDASDASGMNMMDLRTKRWSNECLEAIVQGDKNELPALRARLGCSQATGDNIVNTHELVGRVSRYFVERYGFPANCMVGSFTGDNPASMAGLCVRRDELVLSLGTSDTAFFWLEHPTPGINGHVLRNPLDEHHYMGLICFKNGSRTRERIRDTCAKSDWSEFGRLLDSVPRGNFGNIGFYFDLREIYPLVSGDFRYNKLNKRVDSFAPEIEVRALLEGQMMRLYHHSRALGLDMSTISRVLVTGGASANRSILHVAADVFRSPVYALDQPNSACLGAAYLAKYAHELGQLVRVKLDQTIKQAFGEQPAPDNDKDIDDNEIGNNSCTSALNKQVDFAEMVLGAGANDHHQSLVKCAEPTPIASQVDVYETLIGRYVSLETELGVNNDANISQ